MTAPTEGPGPFPGVKDETPLRGKLQRLITGGHGQPAEKRPQTVTGPLGTVPGSPIDTTADLPVPRRLSQAQAQNLLHAELLSAVQSLNESTTQIVGRLKRRGAVNGVMESWAGVIPASGVLARTYEVAVGSVSCENLSAANRMTITSGVPSGDTGGQLAGTGVSYVRANSRGIAPIADHGFTIAGTPGDLLSFEVFTGMQPYGGDL